MIAQKQCGLDENTQQLLISVFQQMEKIEQVILFGSRALGNFKRGSDIDFAVVAPKLSLSEFLAIHSQVDDLMLPYKVDAILYHNIDNQPLIEHIRQMGKVFYKK